MQLTRRKKRQIRRFLADSPKGSTMLQRLKNIANSKGNLIKSARLHSILHTTIAGKPRTIKISPDEQGARGNLSILLRAHRDAVESGRIKPQHYILEKSKYVYADARAGIMETVQGVGLHSLDDALEGCYAEGVSKLKP